jgi:hypothetical protein
VIDRTDVEAWQGGAGRVTESGFAFWIDTQPEHGPPTYGNGPIVVLKSTGEGWYLSSNPDSLPMFHATTERAFRKAQRKAMGRRVRPDFVVPPR